MVLGHVGDVGQVADVLLDGGGRHDGGSGEGVEGVGDVDVGDDGGRAGGL